MSLLATAVLIGFITVSAALILRSRRPESDSPSDIMLQLMDGADELERRETPPQPQDAVHQASALKTAALKTAALKTSAQDSSTEAKRHSKERTSKERLRKNSPLAPIASR